MNNQQRGAQQNPQQRLLQTGTQKTLPEVKQAMSSTQRWYYIGAFVAGLLIGGGAMLLWGDQASITGSVVDRVATTQGEGTADAGNNSNSEGEGTTDVSDTLGIITNSTVTTGGVDALAVADQLPGQSVTVSGSLDAQSWIVIHEDRDGGWGNALGAAWFPAGSVDGVVQLLRETSGETLYHAVVYRDNGDKLFDLHQDNPVRNSAGNFIETEFRTTSGASAR